jgi:hypothetical protein
LGMILTKKLALRTELAHADCAPLRHNRDLVLGISDPRNGA